MTATHEVRIESERPQVDGDIRYCLAVYPLVAQPSRWDDAAGEFVDRAPRRLQPIEIIMDRSPGGKLSGFVRGPDSPAGDAALAEAFRVLRDARSFATLVQDA